MNMYGITNIKIEAIEVARDGEDEVNEFLAKHNGNIIDIKTVPMFQGWTKYVVVYTENQ